MIGLCVQSTGHVHSHEVEQHSPQSGKKLFSKVMVQKKTDA